MKDWNYASNDVYQTASYILDEGPWYSFVLEDIIMTVCSWVPQWNLPFGNTINITDEDGHEYTLNEWYGGLDGVFHCHICAPITHWCESKKKSIWVKTEYMEDNKC